VADHRIYNSIMPKRWQMRTWTKGTGASVEPAGADDRPPVRARPGSPPGQARPRRPAAQQLRPATARTPHRVSSAARRRHALGYLEPDALDRLEALEAALDAGPAQETSDT